MKIKNKILNILFIITFVFLVILPADASAISTGNVYLSPATDSLIVSNQLNLSVRINPATAINTVQATINFDPHYLTFASSTNNGSPFSSCLPDTLTASSVSITCAILGGSTSTDSLIKTLTFNTISIGSTSLSITNSLSANNGTSYYPTNSGSSINIASQPTPTQSTNIPPAKTYNYQPKTSSIVTAPTQPVVKLSPINLNLKSNVISLYSLKAIINIKTSLPASFYIKYGLSPDFLT